MTHHIERDCHDPRIDSGAMIMHELRCGTTMHGRMLSEKELEVKCKRRACGHEPGVVVLHVFDVTTGKLLSTKKYADPQKGRTNYGTSQSSLAVRSA